jgi:hypothetical protein
MMGGYILIGLPVLIIVWLIFHWIFYGCGMLESCHEKYGDQWDHVGMFDYLFL